jgi:drug/metabolite transporter (DMT)-like permease
MVSYFYLFLAAFFWGTSFIAGKFAFEGIDPVLVTLFRFLIAASFMLPIFLRNISKVTVKLWLLSLLIIPTTFLLQFIGLSYTSASSSAIIIGIEPLIIGLIGLIFWKEKFEKKDIVASIFAFIGIALIIGQPEKINYFGIFLVFLSTIVVAFWVKFSKKYLATIKYLDFSAIIIVLGTILLIPISLVLTKDFSPDFTLQNVAAILYLGLGCSLMATVLWNKGLSKVPSNRSGLFLALEPVFGVLLGVLLLKDPFGWVSFVGFLLVVVPIITISYLAFIPKKSEKA